MPGGKNWLLLERHSTRAKAGTSVVTRRVLSLSFCTSNDAMTSARAEKALSTTIATMSHCMRRVQIAPLRLSPEDESTLPQSLF